MPDGLDAPAPVVINFHALAADPLAQMLLTGMDNLADVERFMVVYPRGQYGAQVWPVLINYNRSVPKFPT